MQWYLVHTKPRQEKCALDNLENQGYECYLPTLPVEKLCQGLVSVVEEALFPRYLFIRLGIGNSAKSWSPIRSTRGVSRLVCFGQEPTRVSEDLISHLKTRQAGLSGTPERLFNPGERVLVTAGPFAGLEGVYQMTDGDQRVMVLIEMLSKPVRVKTTPDSVRKVG